MINDLIYNLSSNLKKGNFWDFYNQSKPIIIDNFCARQVVAGNDFTIMNTDDNKLYVFGSNEFHQLGLREKKNMYDPINYIDYLKSLNKNNEIIIKDKNNLNIIHAKSSGKFNFLLTDKGEVIMLSHLNPYKKLIKIPKVIEIPNVKFSMIECGKNFCILLSVAGVLYSFGENKYGQLGHGDFDYRYFPEEIKILKDNGVKTVQLSCGYKHVIIRSSFDKVYTWGAVNFF
jgi:alpha-tubulin suppressor-like RCC1 family protein